MNTSTAPQIDASHPYLSVDMSRCVYCYRCVENLCRIARTICLEYIESRIQGKYPTRRRKPVQKFLCKLRSLRRYLPNWAIENKSVLEYGSAECWIRTTCPYRGTGCVMDVGVKNNKIVEIKPPIGSQVNRGHLCVKGKYPFEFVYSNDRITKPMIRKNGKWETVPWEEAISYTAKMLKRFIDKYGPDSIGILVSARSTNEESYLAQKFARVVVGTNNVDSCARVCHAPTAAAMKMMLGTGAATNSFDDIEKANTIIVSGANPTENHPIVGARIKQRAINGANLIVIDPRKIELCKYANVHLPIRPGTNIPLFNAMAHTIIEEKLYDEEFISKRVLEIEKFCNFIKEWSPERVSNICGVEAQLIRKAARIYATQKPSLSFHGIGLTEHTQGTENIIALTNLALLTGNIGEPGV